MAAVAGAPTPPPPPPPDVRPGIAAEAIRSSEFPGKVTFPPYICPVNPTAVFFISIVQGEYRNVLRFVKVMLSVTMLLEQEPGRC